MPLRIVLACVGVASVTAVATELKVSRDTVREWRSRLQVPRVKGVSDEPWPRAPRKITVEQVELVITKTLEERRPGEDTHWSTRSMAAAMGMSSRRSGRIWRAFGPATPGAGLEVEQRPTVHREDRDIVGLYLDPPEVALVLAVDGKARSCAGPHRPLPADAAHDPSADDRSCRKPRAIGSPISPGAVAGDVAAMPVPEFELDQDPELPAVVDASPVAGEEVGDGFRPK